MSPFASDREEPLSAITIQSLADIGYAVDVSRPTRTGCLLQARLHGERRVAGSVWRTTSEEVPVSVIDTNGDVVRIIE